ncbi:iron-siderophore ABC transporter substrate-binding protein [Marinobacter maroccanus]|uniref:iron-siderophore ABC transporter substrate-binding protein n=1 Tax=Marinobacter maroccanus TaxID=2055143 RepID=UPI001F542184|nr:iron-siderophore ABC transporter substrate-binding protein [Marinobacter maroccanus]
MSGFPRDTGQSFPIRIEHAFGTTVINETPERVATVAWANHEVPLALGIVPVGFASAGFGDDDGDGVLPWVSARLRELGAETPVLFDEGDGIDFEAVAATRPDVILAAYSGLSQADYDTLSLIAPVVAYPDSPWSTGWREMIRINSTGLGMAAEGDALIARLEAQIADSVAEYPEIRGKSAMFITHLDPTDLSIMRFYSANDTRVSFFEDLGMHTPDSVKQVTGQGQYSGEVSIEKIDLFNDVDIFVTYGSEQLLGPLRSNPLTSRMPAIKSGAIVVLGRGPVATAANPTPLSIPWVLDDYVAALAEAARKSE